MDALLRHLRTQPPNSDSLKDADTAVFKAVQAISSDLDYLENEIKTSIERVHSVRKSIHEQLNLVQIRRTSILGVLAGLYIPLSFVTVRQTVLTLLAS